MLFVSDDSSERSVPSEPMCVHPCVGAEDDTLPDPEKVDTTHTGVLKQDRTMVQTALDF